MIVTEGKTMKEIEECAICGKPYEPKHGNETMCPECREVIKKHRGRQIPNCWNSPYTNVYQYEAIIRHNAYERAKHNDNIVAEGYAERQIAKSLELAGTVNTEL